MWSGQKGAPVRYRERTTVYLPVFHDGALLFMGDGHAAQGDGELTGDALETSMEFEFTVDVIARSGVATRGDRDGALAGGRLQTEFDRIGYDPRVRGEIRRG